MWPCHLVPPPSQYWLSVCPSPPQESAALEHVVGFTVANDVSARDWQMRRNGRQWLLGKTFDTFCPLGPAIVTKDSVTGGDGTGREVDPRAWGPRGVPQGDASPAQTSTT